MIKSITDKKFWKLFRKLEITLTSSLMQNSSKLSKIDVYFKIFKIQKKYINSNLKNHYAVIYFVLKNEQTTK